MLRTEHRLVRQWLADFDRLATVIDDTEVAELRREVQAHLTESIPADASDDDAALVLLDFGSPADVLGTLARPRRSGGTRRRRGAVLALVAAGVLLIAAIGAVWAFSRPAATSGGLPADGWHNPVRLHPAEGPDRTTSGRAYAEYLATQKGLRPLPAGAVWPEGVPVGLDAGPTDSRTGVMQSGAGDVVAHYTWVCAWEAEMIHASGVKDDRRLVAADRELARFFAGDFARQVSPDGAWKQAAYDPTRLDDFSGMRNDLPPTCTSAGIYNVTAR
jgi:hypothetical protein